MAVTVRPLAAEDQPVWRDLWQGYLDFYKTELAPEVSDSTWGRIIQPDGDLIGLGACVPDRGLVGIAHGLVHGGTWSPKPICYVEDLYVSPAARGQGAGRALIDHFAEMGRKAGWLRLYWQTAQDNKTAQALYDQMATRTGWVRYEMDL